MELIEHGSAMPIKWRKWSMWNMDRLCDNKRIKYKKDRIKIKYDNSNKIVRLTAIRWVNEVGIN